MEEEQDVAIILCNTTDIPSYVPAHLAYCHKCNVELWLSKTGQRQAEVSGLPVKPICSSCMMKLPKEERGELSLPSDEMIAEIADKTGKSEDFIREQMKKLVFGINAADKFESN